MTQERKPTPDQQPDLMNALSAAAWPFGFRDDLYCGEWLPLADIIDLGERFLIRLEAPGVQKADLKLELEKNLLIVSGKRTRGQGETDARLIRSERRCGGFKRSFRLPPNLDRNAITANLTNGVLDINLPKTEETKPKKVEISIA